MQEDKTAVEGLDYTKLVSENYIYLTISSSTDLVLTLIIKHYEEQGFHLVGKTQLTSNNKIRHLAEMRITSQEIFRNNY